MGARVRVGEERYRKVQFLAGTARQEFHPLPAETLESEHSVQLFRGRAHRLAGEVVGVPEKLERCIARKLLVQHCDLRAVAQPA